MKHPDNRIQELLDGLASPRLATIDLSLERVKALLKALGNPQDHLPPVIHVAGTNGKGSLVAYLTAIFKAAGYRVHRYTSPHLVRINEDILLAGKEIDDEKLRGFLERILPLLDQYPVTYFEAITAAAFLAFRETPADIVLLETGLGGRLDATNTVKKPLVTAITPVSMDHKEFLGNTIAQIAAEKAGIMKANVPCIVGPQSPEALRIIERVANNVSSPLLHYGNEWSVDKTENGFKFHSENFTMDSPKPNLAGEHQIYNAATAVAVIHCIKGFSIKENHIRKGITHALWPARLQHLTQGKLVELLPDGAELWLDGGHNEGAARILADWLQKQKKPIHVICGMLKNKDTETFIATLAPHVKSLVAVPIEDQPLSQFPEVIAKAAAVAGIKNYHMDSFAQAIELIVNDNKNDFIILICGSLYLAGNILWQNNIHR